MKIIWREMKQQHQMIVGTCYGLFSGLIVGEEASVTDWLRVDSPGSP